MTDARNMSPPRIAEDVDVTSAMIRNRIDCLESQGIITGYPGPINFERINGQLTALFIWSVAFENQESAAQQVQNVSGVIKVHELLERQSNLHVLALGENLDDFHQIACSIRELDIAIKNIALIHDEFFIPYRPFQPNSD